ncbi:MAG: hypothetical protein F6K24_30070, partial [Okeania sp. SIO2D1]|nr:hypothetical protein [Okeania sp. SIO2D1]
TDIFFGFRFTPAAFGTDPATLDFNGRVDINASGAINGVISLPDVSLITNSLNELPDTLIDPDELMKNSCIVRTEAPESTFFITGKGGIAFRPGDPGHAKFATGEVRNLPGDTEPNTWEQGEPIVEPQGVYRLPDGRLVLSRECS